MDRFRYDTRFIVLDFAFTVSESSERPSWDLFDTTMLALLSFRKKDIAARECRKIHDVKQMRKTVPFVTRDTTFKQHVCHLVFGVDMFDLNLGTQIDSVERPIQRNSVCPRNMFHRWASSFDDHCDNCLFIFKDVQTRFTMRRVCVHWNFICIRQINLFGLYLLCLGVIFGLAPVFRELGIIEFALPFVEGDTSIKMSHRSRTAKPSIRSPASNEMISNSVEQCDTEVCLLHI